MASHRNDKVPGSDSEADTNADHDNDTSPPAEIEPAQEDPEVEDLLAQMPPEMRQSFSAFMSLSQRPTGPVAQIINKFTDAHVSQYLDQMQRDYDNEHELRRSELDLRKSNRIFRLIYVAIIVAALGAAIVYLLPRDKDFLDRIIETVVIFGGGIGVGYGWDKISRQ